MTDLSAFSPRDRIRRAGTRGVVALLALLLAAAALPASGAAAQSSGATTYAVSPAGNDDGPGSDSSPFRTIARALKALRPGDTLLVGGGTYEERVKTAVAAGTPQQPVVVRARSGERPVLRGLLWLTGPSNWTISGLNVTWDDRSSRTEHMVKLTGGTGWSFVDAEVWGARSYAAILVAGAARDFRLAGLYVHHTHPANGTNQDHLIYVNAPEGGGVIERNVLAVSPNGRAVKIGPPSSDKPGTSGLRVAYNTMVDNFGPSNVQIAWGSSNNRIERNIMVRPASGRSAVTGYEVTGTGNLVGDNVAWQTPRVLDEGQPGLVDGGGNRLLDPQLTDPQSGDFRPRNPDAAGYGAHAGDPPPATPTASPSSGSAGASPSSTPEPGASPSSTPEATPPAATGVAPDAPTEPATGSVSSKLPAVVPTAQPSTGDAGAALVRGEPIEFVGASQNANHVAPSLVIPAPEGARAGDVMIASVDVRGRPDVTPPPGWTQVAFDRNGTALTKATFVSVHAGPRAASFSFSKPQAAAGVMAAYRGVDLAAPVAAVERHVSARTTSVVLPGMHVPAADGRAIRLVGVANKGWIDFPAGPVERADVANATSRYFVVSALADEPVRTSTVDALVAASRHAGAAIAHVVVLRPRR